MQNVPVDSTADICGTLLASLVAANNEPLRTELCKALGQLRGTKPEGTVVEHLYWPSGLESHDYLEAAEQLEFLVRSAPASTIYGALAEETLIHGNGVIRIGVHLMKSESTEWALHVLPWSRHVPTGVTLMDQQNVLQKALQNTPKLAGLAPQDVFLNLQPVVASNHEAISHGREFHGESLGLAILLVLFANVKHRHVDGWATGKIAENGTTLEAVNHVDGKAKALGHFLTDRNSGPTEAERRRFRLFVVGEANKSDVTKGLGEALSAEFLDRTVVARSVDELLQPEKLWDPFHLEPGLCQNFFARVGIPDAVAFPTPGDTEFLHALAHVEQDVEVEGSETLGGQVVHKWIGWDEDPQRDLDAREILACIPFHADAKAARNFLCHSAAGLAAYVRWRRAMQQRAFAGTLFPVPVVLEVGKWKASQVSLAEFLLSKAKQGLTESGPTLKEIHSSNELTVEHIQEALSEEYRFCVILTDANIDRSRSFEEPTVTSEGRANQPFWNAIETLLGHRAETGVARQCLLLLAPDIHVQMFWEEQLRKMPYELEFKTEKLPIAAAIQK